jgi:uncharacterized caspase-like protein
VNEYKDVRIPKLKGALNDAVELRQHLSESGGFDIPDEHLLLDNDASCQNIRRGISDLLWKPDPCDLTLFYFSGHGLQDSAGNGYIAPVDMQADQPLVCGVRMQELRELVLSAQNKQSVIVILDCCYSGIATEGKGGDMELAVEDLLVDQCFSPFADQETGRGKVILASSGKNEKSHEVCCGHELGKPEPHDHGLFTFHLLEGLDGQASETEDITLDGLHRYLVSQLHNDPQHKMSFFGAGLSQADQIKIARASRRRDFQNKLAKAADYLKKYSPSTAFKAARLLGEVLDWNPNYRDALNLRDLINARLKEYQGAVNAWMAKNRTDIVSESADIETSNFLQQNFSHLCVEVILKASASRRELLAGVCDAALGTLPWDSFLVLLANAVPDSQAPSADQPLSGGPRTG